MTDAGFILAISGSDASLAVSNEPQHVASHTSVWRTSDCEFVVLGRLYYRGDRLQWLRTRIASAEFEACKESDAAMVAFLFREGGAQALTTLEGDFVAAGFIEFGDSSSRFAIPSVLTRSFGWPIAGRSLSAHPSVRSSVISLASQPTTST